MIDNQNKEATLIEVDIKMMSFRLIRISVKEMRNGKRYYFPYLKSFFSKHFQALLNIDEVI